MGAAVGETVAFGMGIAVAADSGMAEGEDADSAAAVSEGAEVSTGVIAGSGVFSAAMVTTICSVGALHPVSSRIEADIINKIFFMGYPFQRINIF